MQFKSVDCSLIRSDLDAAADARSRLGLQFFPHYSFLIHSKWHSSALADNRSDSTNIYWLGVGYKTATIEPISR